MRRLPYWGFSQMKSLFSASARQPFAISFLQLTKSQNELFAFTSQIFGFCKLDVCGFFALMLAGCDRDNIKVYRLAKDDSSSIAE